MVLFPPPYPYFSLLFAPFCAKDPSSSFFPLFITCARCQSSFSETPLSLPGVAVPVTVQLCGRSRQICLPNVLFGPSPPSELLRTHSNPCCPEESGVFQKPLLNWSSSSFPSPFVFFVTFLAARIPLFLLNPFRIGPRLLPSPSPFDAPPHSRVAFV